MKEFPINGGKRLFHLQMWGEKWQPEGPVDWHVWSAVDPTDEEVVEIIRPYFMRKGATDLEIEQIAEEIECKDVAALNIDTIFDYRN